MITEKASVNEGIQANSVTTEVLAVGRGAKAVKIMNTIRSEEIAANLTQLRNAINGLDIDHTTHEAVSEDLNRLVIATSNKQPDKDEIEGLLQSVARKLKGVGVVLSEAISLSGPISKIANLVGIAVNSIW